MGSHRCIPTGAGIYLPLICVSPTGWQTGKTGKTTPSGDCFRRSGAWSCSPLRSGQSWQSGKAARSWPRAPSRPHLTLAEEHPGRPRLTTFASSCVWLRPVTYRCVRLLAFASVYTSRPDRVRRATPNQRTTPGGPRTADRSMLPCTVWPPGSDPRRSLGQRNDRQPSRHELASQGIRQGHWRDRRCHIRHPLPGRRRPVTDPTHPFGWVHDEQRRATRRTWKPSPR